MLLSGEATLGDQFLLSEILTATAETRGSGGNQRDAVENLLKAIQELALLDMIDILGYTFITLGKVTSQEIDARRSRMKMKYEDYLKTDYWKFCRQAKLEESDCTCGLCNHQDNTSKTLQVHHKTYENRGNERLEDLIVLCEDCHAKFHDKLES